jgi:CHAD domain-containing protein
MTRKADILNLCDRFKIERPHVEHVAVLALDIFHGFLPLAGIREKDRRLLYAAACLHDIGYAADPQNHAEAGVRILLENPLPSFSSKDWKTVAAIVLLHRRNWQPMLSHELFAEMKEPWQSRAGKLASILRIADGLDHSHLQDARITFCRRGKNVDRIGVNYSWYAGNIPWAQGKADLWEEIFKRPLRIKGARLPSRQLFDGVVYRKDSAGSAARRIFYSQYDVMRDQVPGMLADSDPEFLHNYRVAMRRFRVALRMFRPLLNDTGSQELEQPLRTLSNRLSPIRDTQVFFQILGTLEFPEKTNCSFFQSLKADFIQANHLLAEIIESAECRETIQQMNRFLRVELPVLEQNRSDIRFKPFAKKQLSGLMRRILNTDVSSLGESAEQMHALRKLCRRSRYIAEFTAPVSKKGQKAARHLKAVAGTLGDIRDVQILLNRIQESGCDVQFTEKLEQRRRKGWNQFSKSWKKLAAW